MRICALILALLLLACGAPAPERPGGRLAFRTENSVRVVDLDGNEVATLPCHMSPRFSPDGSRIACLGTPDPQFLQQFQSYVTELQQEFGDQLDPQQLSGFAYHGSIHIAAVDGTDVQKVANHLAFFKVWWSATGDRLFFQSSFGSAEQAPRASQVGSVGALFAVGADGLGVSQLSEPVPMSLSAAATWSADLQWKVATAIQSTAGDVVAATAESLSLAQRIFLFPASGDQARQVSSEPAGFAHANPAISSDARRISYNAVRRSPDDPEVVEATLHVVDFSGEFQSQVATDCTVAEWSGDNQRLLLSCAESRVTVLDLATGTRAELGEGLYPVFSPDEIWVGFVRRTEATSQVHIARVDGTESRQVIELPGAVDQLEW